MTAIRGQFCACECGEVVAFFPDQCYFSPLDPELGLDPAIAIADCPGCSRPLTVPDHALTPELT